MNVDEKFKQLKVLASNYGYSFSYSSYHYYDKIKTGSAVDHGRKMIITMPKITEREIIGVCHELGHIKDRLKTNKRRNRKNKYIRIYEEVLAWMYAIPYLIKFKTPFLLTVHSIYFSLLSYMKCRRRK
ncbi:hypothetical protein [Niallia taxi]|uniref:hypothetical protein n=1 Tax=Niallia taxi TaxID=2499688 RepID=UPI0030091B0D